MRNHSSTRTDTAINNGCCLSLGMLNNDDDDDDDGKPLNSNNKSKSTAVRDCCTWCLVGFTSTNTSRSSNGSSRSRRNSSNSRAIP